MVAVDAETSLFKHMHGPAHSNALIYSAVHVYFDLTIVCVAGIPYMQSIDLVNVC